MMEFAKAITDWYREHHRSLPWRVTRDPYKIWVSEVILQQTRVDQGLSYYLRFIDRFPDVKSLAKATENEVLKLWQGLGYYSRARNMQHAARTILEHHGGTFPDRYDEIRQLKGIGEYTASAVASIAFGLPHPALDGNVMRFISRLIGMTSPVSSAEARRTILEFLEIHIDRTDPGRFNQAVMEFGALVCTPRKPACANCPLASSCVAFNTGQVDRIPVKDKKKDVPSRYFHYLIILFRENNRVFTFLHRRSDQDIWENLYEFPLIEAHGLLHWKTLTSLIQWKEMMKDNDWILIEESGQFKHLLTHRKLIARYFVVEVKVPPQGYTQIPLDDLEKYPVPRLVEKIIEQSNITFFQQRD